MGHYMSEMMCNKCGKMRCTCIMPPSPEQWTFDKNFEVKSRTEFLKSNHNITWMCRDHFDSPEEANEALEIALIKEIAAVKARLATLEVLHAALKK